MPYRPPPNRTRSSRALGHGQRAGGVGDVPDLGRDARLLGVRDRVDERGQLGRDRGVPGQVGAGEVGPQARHLEPPGGLGGQGGLHHGGPVGAGGAAAGQAGVGLQVQPGRDARAGRGLGHLGHDRDRGCGDVDARADRVRRLTDGHQAQHRGGDPGRPQRERLGQVGGAEPGRAAGQRGPRRRDHAVPVPVRLDHGHHLAAADPLAQGRDVAGDRAEVDAGLPLGGCQGGFGVRPPVASTVHQLTTARMAAGSAVTTSKAPIGASGTGSVGAPRRRPGRRVPAAASRAARPCR